MMQAMMRSSHDETEWVDVDDFDAPASVADYEPRLQGRDNIDAAFRGSDFLSLAGARELKRRIEAYWAERGYEVRISLEEGPFHAAVRSARQDVRSDMVNGLPRPKAG